MPFSRYALQRLFVRLPQPVSRLAYSAWRGMVKDGKKPLFREAFNAATSLNVEGDYLEFGVFRGTSFILAFNTARELGLDQMQFWAFDGFVGLPSSEGHRFAKGEYACSRPMFERTIHSAGVDKSRVHIVEGLYQESLTRPEETYPRKASVIHVDCDLYSSTLPVLLFVGPLLQPQSVMIFDDWHDPTPEKAEPSGEARAFHDWASSDEWRLLYDAPPSRAYIYEPAPSTERVPPNF